MKSKNGSDYAQNYDVIIKWMAEALQGETLEVLGIKTGRIEEVFGFEPIDIAVKAGRVDVMLRDDTGAVFHIEEQRNLEKADLYRFASYHFQGARQWPKLKDIILASGKVYKGSKVIKTESGKYEPVVIDFTKKDGRKRLAEIREEISAGTFEHWLELVFLPLYGKETGIERSEMVEDILRFESELCRTDKIPVRLMAAALILSNKMIDKNRLKALWEDIKMLDIFEIAKEEGKSLGIQEGKSLGIQEGKSLGIQEGKSLGIQEGKSLGIQEGKSIGVLEERREMLVETLIERFKLVSAQVSEKIRSLQNPDVLKSLFHQALRCRSLEEFELIMEQVR